LEYDFASEKNVLPWIRDITLGGQQRETPANERKIKLAIQ